MNHPTSTDDTDNDANADEAVDTDESAEKDVHPDWKPSSNDANEELPEDEDIEYDEDEPPISNVRRGAQKVDVASLPKGAPTTDVESESDDDFSLPLMMRWMSAISTTFLMWNVSNVTTNSKGVFLLLTLVSYPALVIVHLFQSSPENVTTTWFVQPNFQT